MRDSLPRRSFPSTPAPAYPGKSWQVAPTGQLPALQNGGSSNLCSIIFSAWVHQAAMPARYTQLPYLDSQHQAANKQFLYQQHLCLTHLQ